MSLFSARDKERSLPNERGRFGIHVYLLGIYSFGAQTGALRVSREGNETLNGAKLPYLLDCSWHLLLQKREREADTHTYKHYMYVYMCVCGCVHIHTHLCVCLCMYRNEHIYMNMYMRELMSLQGS